MHQAGGRVAQWWSRVWPQAEHAPPTKSLFSAFGSEPAIAVGQPAACASAEAVLRSKRHAVGRRCGSARPLGYWLPDQAPLWAEAPRRLAGAQALL